MVGRTTTQRTRETSLAFSHSHEAAEVGNLQCGLGGKITQAYQKTCQGTWAMTRVGHAVT